MPSHPPDTATLLVVDDQPMNLELLVHLLSPHYRVRAANSGQRALQLAHSGHRPDLVLLDIMMPDMDGIEVLARLQNDPRTTGIPVIFITAKDATSDELLGLEHGAVDYITKPFHPSIVLARVRTQLELKAMRDRLAGENERLDAEVARRMQENVLIQDASIRALANLAEIRDMETGNHILRTQSYVELLAGHLAVKPRFREALSGGGMDLLVKAAPLHDMGKVGIPDAVLLKPDRLDAAEFEVMKTHTTLGAEAIGRAMRDAVAAREGVAPATVAGALRFMELAQQIAATHHEHWDGSGYPKGLAGEAIPVAGRLMALADVYDALTCRRVYKNAYPLSDAAEQIVAGRGRQFDPDVVDAFVELRPRFEQVAQRFRDSLAALA
jgi:putative two-component system response regulator